MGGVGLGAGAVVEDFGDFVKRGVSVGGRGEHLVRGVKRFGFVTSEDIGDIHGVGHGFDAVDIEFVEFGDVGEDRAELVGEMVQVVVGEFEATELGHMADVVLGDVDISGIGGVIILIVVGHGNSLWIDFEGNPLISLEPGERWGGGTKIAGFGSIFLCQIRNYWNVLRRLKAQAVQIL